MKKTCFNIFIAIVASAFLCSCSSAYYNKDADFKYIIIDRNSSNKLSKIIDLITDLIPVDDQGPLVYRCCGNDNLDPFFAP